MTYLIIDQFLFNPFYQKLVKVSLILVSKNFFNKYNVITSSQYGFLKNKSTEQALLTVKDKIIKNIEMKQYTLGLFLDFRKAFDCVHHNTLLRKLNSYGIRGIASDLLKSYLNNRLQYVQVNGIPS